MLTIMLGLYDAISQLVVTRKSIPVGQKRKIDFGVHAITELIAYPASNLNY